MNVEKNEQSSEINIRILLKIFISQRKFISIFILSCIVITFIYTAISPRIYEAEATLLPPEKSMTNSSLASFLQNIPGGLNFASGNAGSKSQIYSEILKSRETAYYIIKVLDLKNKPDFKQLNDEELCGFVRQSLDVTVNSLGVVFVTATASTHYLSSSNEKDSVAKFAADLSNKAIEALDYINKTKNTTNARKVKEFIERVLLLKKAELDSLQHELENYQKNNKILYLDKQAQSILTETVAIGSEMAKAEIELKVIANEYNTSSPYYQAYLKKYTELKAQYERSQRGGLSGNNDYSIPLSDLPELIRNFTNLSRNVKILEEVVTYLETQRMDQVIQEAKDVSTVEPLDKAYVPLKPTSPRMKVMLILGLMISLVISLTIVTVKAFIQGLIYINRENKTITENPS